MILIDICRFAIRAAVRLALVALAIAIVVVGVAGARLLLGPVSLASFVPGVEERAAEALGPGRLTIGGADLVLDARARRLRLAIQDTAVLDGDGATVAEFERVSLRLDPVALLTGQVSVLSAVIEGADALLLRTEEGFFRFGLTEAGGGAPADDAPPDGEAFDAVRAAVDSMTGEGDAPAPFEDFQGLTVRDLNVTYRDALGGVVWRAPRTTVDFRNEPDGAWARASTAIDVDGSGQPVRVEISGLRRADDPWLTLDARVDGAPTEALAVQTPELDALTTIQGRVTGALRVRFNLDDGELGELSATLSARDAKIRLSETETAPLTQADASFRFDPAADRLALERFDYVSDGDRGRIAGELSGAIAFERDAEGRTIGALADVSLGPTTIGGPKLFEPPLSLDEGGAKVRVGPAPDGAAIEVSDLSLRGPLADLSGDAVLTIPRSGSPWVEAELTHGRLDAAALDELWPIGPAPGGRAWVAEHLSGGAIDDVAISISVGPSAFEQEPPVPDGAPIEAAPNDSAPNDAAQTAGEASPEATAPIEIEARIEGAAEVGGEAPTLGATGAIDATQAQLDAEHVRITFAVDGLSGTYIRGMPPVVAADGRGSLTMDRFTLDLERAETVSPNGGVARLDGSRFSIIGFPPEPPPAEVRLRASGGLEDIVSLLNSPPLSLIDKFGAKTSDFGGQASVEANLAFPLAKDLALEDIEVGAEAALADLRIDADAAGAELLADAAALYVDKDGLSLRAGAAQVDGRRAAITLNERFAPAERAPRRVAEMRSVVRAAEMTALGDAAERLAGVARLDLRMEARDGQPDQIQARVDLRDLAVDLPEFAWRKRAGEPGALEFDATRSGSGGLTINRFEFGAVDARAEGEIRFNADGALQSLDLDRLVVGDQVDLGVGLRRDGAIWRLTLEGERLDLRAAADQMDADAPAGADDGAAEGGAAPARPSLSPAAAVDLSVAELRLSDDVALQNARITGERAENGDMRFDLEALAGGAPVNGAVRVASGRARASLASPDAGGFLRGVGLLEETRGGQLNLSAEGPLEGPYAGQLVIEGIVFEKVPPLLDAISVGLIFGALDKAASGGLTFSRITVPFTLTDDALNIGDGVAVGPSLGSTFGGTIARETGALDMRGSLSPAYALNGLVGRVPVLGRIITGGRGEGVIGVAFTVRGTTEDPDVSVNPLSALTPGFLRKIFSARPNERRRDSGRQPGDSQIGDNDR